ncbi:MAG: hypothetical protein QOC77_241, partial [Thermoleophilaceae bacterium]|nr:hypothetical protein [Thermoleophilaceae bacterium]
TSQGRMTGDYISTSFNPAGNAVPVFAVGNPHTSAQLFDEAMYAPTTPLPVTPPSQATNTASSAGAQSTTGQGTGETHHALRNG